MKELSKSEAIRLLIKMWNWIADETLRRKKKVTKAEYFCEMRIRFEDRPFANCYCCEYDKQHLNDCSNCPLDWKSEVDSFMCQDKYEMDDAEGLFSQWSREKNYKKAAELAREIANLEERE